jgi:hypothetical protein
MALVFPNPATVGQKYPPGAGTSGVTQYEYDGAKWNAVLSTVSIGGANQGAFNAYKWPATDGGAKKQLTTDGTGTLTWSDASTPSMQVLGLLEPFDGVAKFFTLIDPVTSAPFAPNPSTNLIVFLGGVPQIPSAAYTVTLSTIQFLEPPLLGTTFYALSSVNV